ncbi:outer membrane protein insertion porin family [Deinobacterium chartae]|uniref:Outer membrane protein insertion porin family n=1 Tax=Deinobacterium chartae TaxID=521158 RepID=A0A841HUP1_9DEIO|nr:POTRA domain-containing protein [Deinobacterium chartae]MBB6096636.1 outer membrane protein insertion porin family [Deinobacterium chartae]
MRQPIHVGMTLALLCAPGIAYAQQQATVDDIVVTGASDLLIGLVKVNLNVQPGAPLSSVNLSAVELDTINLGFFKSAQARLLTQDGKNILQIAVVPNPDIRSVVVEDTDLVEAGQIKTFLEQRMNIAEGVTLNTARIEESKTALGQAFRELGLPYVPLVTTDLREENGGVILTYSVDENAPINRIEVTGNTQLPKELVSAAFKPLANNKRFDLNLYQQALQTVAQAYAERGFEGSGPDIAASTLENGVFSVRIRELRIGAIDASAVGGASLKVKPGDLYNVNALTDDERAASNATGRAVTAVAQPVADQPGVVNIVFTPGEAASEPIREIRVAGNSAVSSADIAKVLRLKPGDVYTERVAQRDYLAIQRLYRERGLELTTRDPIRFEGGVLTYTVREVKIAGYTLRWTGAHRTTDRVILREFPAPGSLFDSARIRQGLEAVVRSGLVSNPQVNPVVNPESPESVTLELTFTENSSRVFEPAISYDTISGFAGQLALTDTNLFGLAHQASARLEASPNDAGQVLGGSVSYTIPWLDIDFLDFRKVRTSVSANVFSLVTPNQPIYRRNPDGTINTNDKTGREYSERSTGFNFSVGRPLTNALRLNMGVSTEFTNDFLEVKTSDQKDAPDDAAVAGLIPAPGQTTLLYGDLVYDTADSPDFPTRGYRANLGLGYGFGYQGDRALGWTQITGGARTYFGFGNTLESGSKQQVIAVRANAGALIGSVPDSRLFSLGGSEPTERFTLRGYDPRSFIGQNFFTSSLEYRYNFNLQAGIAQGLYGVAFVDAGDAWTDSNDFNLNFGYGLGVQLNLGVGGALFPALRFDYAFSPSSPSGKFTFRIGSFF